MEIAYDKQVLIEYYTYRVHDYTLFFVVKVWSECGAGKGRGWAGQDRLLSNMSINLFPNIFLQL